MPVQIQCQASKLDARPFEVCNQVDGVMMADIGIKVIFFIGILVIEFDDLSLLSSDFMLDLANISWSPPRNGSHPRWELSNDCAVSPFQQLFP